MKSTITITFGDQAENHIGMQKIGKLAENGFSVDEILTSQKNFENLNFKTEFINLNKFLPDNYESNEAVVMIIRNGINAILSNSSYNTDDIYEELGNLETDKKYWDRRRKKVLNKNARHNLCFGEINQLPDYENGKGRIVSFDSIPITNTFRKNLPIFFGKSSDNLTAEGNYYYDIKKCGIGFHGDSERKKVIAFRLGESMPLHYQWFYKYKPIGERCIINLNHGDVYIMSEKSVGTDWKKSSILTLRHATGCKKYTTIKK